MKGISQASEPQEETRYDAQRHRIAWLLLRTVAMTMVKGRSKSDSPTHRLSVQHAISGPLVVIGPSLSNKVEGSLLFRALSRLKGRKRLWFVLDEGRCRLLYYKSEGDAHTKDPLGSIEVRGAAISLVLEEDNQFIVHSPEGREHALVADDHESMMLWILALQARQDSSGELENGSPSKRKTGERSRVRSSISDGGDGGKAPLLRTHSLQLGNPERKHSGLKRMHSLWADTAAAAPDNGDTATASTNGLPRQPSRVSETDESPAAEQPSMGLSTDTNNNDHGQQQQQQRRQLSRDDSTDRSSDTESCDDSDPSDASPEGGGSERVRLLRKMNSVEGGGRCIALKDRNSSLSGTSASSDSAVGGSDCSNSVRLQELETELMYTKCDLAKSLNRESAYKSIIEEKILLVNELEDRLRAAEDQNGDPVWKSPVHSKGNSLQEKCRILQNHNRFLNEEVLKLSKMLQNEKRNSHSKQQQMRHLECEVDQLKRDYVFLMQSSLKINNSDGPETTEVYLYGGNKHKDRVLSLLQEAKKINPTLPVYENLSRSLCHVDGLGFRKTCSEEPLILHYVCRQLHQHYSALGHSYDQHQQHWKKHLRQHPALPNSKELKSLVRKGVPAHLRSRVWATLYRSRISDLMDSKGPHYYNYLCSLAPDDERVSQHKRQIALDLLRTMPENIRFSDANADGVRKMQEVLQAFCLHNPALGYCQGMNFLVGMCLLFMEPEDSFWCLVAITERYFTANYFDHNLIGAQADQEVLKELLRERMPLLWQHLDRVDIELATVTLNWFLAIFFDCVPFETLLRIWDCFLLEGPKVLFRFSLAILQMNERALLSKHDTVSIMRQLKASARLCYDVDHLFQTAFEELKPFTRRQDIAGKQSCYYKTLKEHAKKMDMEKIAYKDRERMLSELEFFSSNQLVIECAAVYDKDKLWLCHGHQSGAHITKVNCEESIMYRLNIELESRVMCMHALDDDTMLLGTLSHFVHCYSTKSRRLMWETRLNDSVLTLSSHEEDGVRQVYAGLADGTVAVIENIEGVVPKPETFYIMIGSSPITCLLLVERRLWCGTGNRVVILNARTLDAVDQFQSSCNGFDYISMLVCDERGVWISIRGSSVLQLWDAKALTCRLLFDVKDNRYPRSPRMGEDEPGGSRITAVLPFSGSVLVGTAEGSLIIYDVVAKLSRSPSASELGQLAAKKPQDPIQHKIQELLSQQRQQQQDAEAPPCPEKPHRLDSGCYSTPSRTPLLTRSRRGSTGSSPGRTLSTTPDQEESSRRSSSPEDRSEATSQSTVKRAGGTERSSVTSPDAADEKTPQESLKKTTTDEKDDSGQSSSSSRRLCTCQLQSSGGVKCRHCLLEASEALRKLFDKYSLTIESTAAKHRTRKSSLGSSDVASSARCESTSHDENDEDPHPTDPDHPSDAPPETPCADHRPPPSDAEDPAVAPERRSHEGGASSLSSSGSLPRAASADDVAQWVKSQDCGAASSLASDSYDYDDVFVAYTEENDASTQRRKRDSGALLESIRALSRRRSSNLLEYSGASSAALSCSQTNGFPNGGDWWWGGESRRGPDSSTTASSASLPMGRHPRGGGAADVRSQLPAWARPSESESSAGCCFEDSAENGKDSCSEGQLGGPLLQLGGGGDWSHKSSETASNVSFGSTEVPYAYELSLQEKIKISDKPIKCLLRTRCGSEPIIISCAGCYGDDEAVLKWTKIGNEELWTNDPIIEVCPYTNAIKPSPYARSRLPRRTSSIASSSTTRASTSSSSGGSVVGTGLAKVHNIFLRVQEKT